MPAFTVTIDPSQRRNAREAILTRIEGAVTLLDEEVVIENGEDYLNVVLPDGVPDVEFLSIVRTLANLVRRPESGILSEILVLDNLPESAQRRYSA
jgi:hypothetical protein